MFQFKEVTAIAAIFLYNTLSLGFVTFVIGFRIIPFTVTTNVHISAASIAGSVDTYRTPRELKRTAARKTARAFIWTTERAHIILTYHKLQKQPIVRPQERIMVQRIYNEFRFYCRVIFSSAQRFYWDNAFSKAASLAYSSLFALVPITVLAFALLSSFASSSEHLPQAREFIIRQFVPDLAFVNELLSYISQFSQALSSLNTLAVAFVVLTAVLLINSIEHALNEVWQVYQARSLSQRLGIYCAILVLAPVLAISAYYFARLRTFDLWSGVDAGVTERISNSALPFFFDFGAFVALYYLVPKAPVRWMSAVTGAALAAVLFGLAKAGFAHYVEKFASYDKIYGALAAVPIFLLWLYLAWIIVLFGAEVSFQAQMLPRVGILRRRAVMSCGDGRFSLAVQALCAVASAFQKGKVAPNELEIAERMGVSTVILRPILVAFERANILIHGDSRASPLALLKAPDKISLLQISTAVDGTSGEFPKHVASAWEAVAAEKLSETSLQDLLDRAEVKPSSSPSEQLLKEDAAAVVNNKQVDASLTS